MLKRAHELLELPSSRRQLARLYGHVIVDEAQNLTSSQYSLLTALIGSPNSDHLPAMVVGDDKQSIVSFAGADPRLINRFTAEYGATRFELRENFRSAATIVRLSEKLAADLGQPRSTAGTAYAATGLIEFLEAVDEDAEGSLVANWALRLLGDGMPVDALAPGEAAHVRPEDIAVLGRSAATLRATRIALEAVGHAPAMASSPDDWLTTVAGKVALEMVSLRSATSHQSTHWQLARLLVTDEDRVRSSDQLYSALEEHQDITLRSLRVLCEVDSPHSFIAALRELKLPPTDTGDAWLASWDADCRQFVEAWDSFIASTDVSSQSWGNFRLFVSRIQRGDDLDPGVRLLTIHKAQGREYRAVAVVGMNNGQLPDFRATAEDERLAELRTFYVAVTRAARVLLLTRPLSRQTRYGSRSSDPSPFLAYLGAGH
jgi:superfamily I DNA/RNA helicase